MGAPQTWVWVYLAVGWAAVGVGAMLAAWALFRDRARGRRRCPKCWYDMKGTPGLRCPECGREARDEKRLSRTRRRWRWAVLGALVIVAGSVAMNVPKYQKGGWVALVPSSVLVYAAPAQVSTGGWTAFPTAIVGRTTPMVPGFLAPPPPPPQPVSEQLANELWNRMRTGRLAAWQSQAYLQRYLDRNGLDIAKSLTLPARWPLNEPIPARLDPRNIGGLEVQARVVGGSWVGPKSAVFAARPVACRDIDVELGLRTGRVVYRTTRRMPVFVEGSAEAFLEKVNSPADTDLVRAALNPHLSRAGGMPVLILYDRTSDEIWSKIAFGIAYTVEIAIDGQVVATGRGTVQWSREVWKGWDEVTMTWTDREALMRKDARVTLTVRGDHAAVTQEYLTWPFDKPSASCWTGEFTMSLEFKDHPGETK